MGVESVTPEGLKAIFKDFNYAGDKLVTRLKEFRKHGVHILGSFIFGLPTDKEDTFDATAELAQRSDIAFAQFIMLTPFPGTVDFAKWEEKMASDPTRIAGYPLTRFWLIPREQRPKVYTPHPMLSPDQIRRGTQSVWDRFYSIPAIWERASIIKSLRGRVAVRDDFEALPPDVREHRHRDRQRARDPLRTVGPSARTPVPPVVRHVADARPASAELTVGLWTLALDLVDYVRLDRVA